MRIKVSLPLYVRDAPEVEVIGDADEIQMGEIPKGNPCLRQELVHNQITRSFRKIILKIF